jgi:hypothetical protein
MWVYFMDIWSILRSFGKFCGNLVYLSRFGMLYQEISGNPGLEQGDQIRGTLAS